MAAINTPEPWDTEPQGAREDPAAQHVQALVRQVSLVAHIADAQNDQLRARVEAEREEIALQLRMHAEQAQAQTQQFWAQMRLQEQQTASQLAAQQEELLRLAAGQFQMSQALAQLQQDSLQACASAPRRKPRKGLRERLRLKRQTAEAPMEEASASSDGLHAWHVEDPGAKDGEHVVEDLDMGSSVAELQEWQLEPISSAIDSHRAGLERGHAAGLGDVNSLCSSIAIHCTHEVTDGAAGKPLILACDNQDATSVLRDDLHLELSELRPTLAASETSLRLAVARVVVLNVELSVIGQNLKDANLRAELAIVSRDSAIERAQGLQEKLDGIVLKLRASEAELKTSVVRASELEAKLSDRDSALNALEQRIAAVEVERDTLRQDLRDLKMLLQQRLDDSVPKLRASEEELKTAVVRASNALGQQVAALEVERDTLRQELRGLQRQHGQTCAKRDLLEQQLDGTVPKLRASEAELKTSVVRASELEATPYIPPWRCGTRAPPVAFNALQPPRLSRHGR